MTGPAPDPASTTVSVPAVRTLAGTWARNLDAMAQEMYEFLAERIPHADEPDIAGLTLASCASNIEAILSMIRHGIPATATEAPVAALEHARKMAVRGYGIDATLRFYRLGHAYFWERWSTELVAAIEDRDELVTAMRETAVFAFHYIDAVSSRVGTEYLAERDRRQRRAAVVRDDVVRALLAGEPVDPAAAEPALGHQLRGPQRAVLWWTDDGDQTTLERAAGVLARAVGVRPLLVPDGPDALGGWFGGDHPLPDGWSTLVRDAAPDVHVALGGVHEGIEGFRRSRDEADRARRVARLGGRRAPTVTAYVDIALADLLSRDLDAARAFVRGELGPLAGPGPAAQRARDTLAVVAAPGGGIATAARELGVHRNTVLQRVRRAEELRGRPVDERPGELHAALVLARILGASVLDD
ncbi:MAG: PucR family transcriptional regulator [Solirubrobacteraceae bacterium]